MNIKRSAMEDNMATNRIITNTENDRHACPLTVSLSLFTTVDVPFIKQKFNDTVIAIQSFLWHAIFGFLQRTMDGILPIRRKTQNNQSTEKDNKE